MSLFNFSEEEFLTFFMVLVRFSVVLSVLPFIGDRLIPTPVKILLALVISIVLFPALVASKQVTISDANSWGKTAGGIIGTVSSEVIFGLLLGYTARLLFESITFGGNLVGNFMGFGSASTYDPHQETQTELIAQFQASLAMLLFLVLDGHHLMLRASLDSYKIIGIGGLKISATVVERLVYMTGEVFNFGLQIAAPIAIVLFSVNVTFGIISRAVPQMNVLVMSLVATALIGFIVMYFSMPMFQTQVEGIFSRMNDWLGAIMQSMASRR